MDFFVGVKKKVVFGILVAVLIGISYFIFQGKKEEQGEKSAFSIETAIVERKDIKISVSGSGQVFADSQVNIRPQVAGDGLDVLQVAVKNGQEVGKNDLIAVLDTKDAQKKIRDAELSLRNAQIKMSQTKSLYDSQTEEDKWNRQLQEVSLRQSENNLADAKEDLQDYYIRAPFDGVVTGLNVEVGDSISREEILASIITDEMYAEISLNEVDAVKIKEGDKAILTFDALSNISIEGTVRRIDTIGTVDQGVVYFIAQISIDKQNESLRPGMSVSAEIVSESKEGVLVVPVAAVKNGENGNFVQVIPSSVNADVENLFGKTERKTVETGISDDIVIEIIKGLSEGDRIVVRNNSMSSLGDQEGQNKGLLDAVRIPGSGAGMRR